MKLSPNWITEGLVDYEYKKYQLLAYLQTVEAHFTEAKLYPPYSELYGHYRQLVVFKQSQEELADRFPKQFKLTDGRSAPVQETKPEYTDAVLNEINDIVAFSIPEMASYLEQGRTIYHEVEDQLQIEPIGLWHQNQDDGFFMLAYPSQQSLPVFRYRLTVYESSGENYRGVHVQYLENVDKTLANSFESLKTEISNKHFMSYVPGSYLIQTKFAYPLTETILPITKRLLVKYIAKQQRPTT